MLGLSNDWLDVCHRFSGVQKCVGKMRRGDDEFSLTDFISGDTVSLDLGRRIALDRSSVERITEDHHTLDAVSISIPTHIQASLQPL